MFGSAPARTTSAECRVFSHAPQSMEDRAGRALISNTPAPTLRGASGPSSFDRAFYSSHSALVAAPTTANVLNTNSLGLQTSGMRATRSRVWWTFFEMRGFRRRCRGSHDRSPIKADPRSLDFAHAPRAAARHSTDLNAGWTRRLPRHRSRDSPALSYQHGWNGSVQGHTELLRICILSRQARRCRDLADSRRGTRSARRSVLVNSSFADGHSGVGSIGFGGASTSSSTRANSVELTNHCHWFSENNKHRIKLATDVPRRILARSVEQSSWHICVTP